MLGKYMLEIYLSALSVIGLTNAIIYKICGD